MDEATIAITAMTGSLFLIFLGLFIWGFKSGQFKDVEEPKYRMLKDKNGEKHSRQGDDS